MSKVHDAKIIFLIRIHDSKSYYSTEKWNEESINLLKKSGINFDLLAARGIEYNTFAEYFISSGLVMNKDMHWYGFHTDHDFAYLMRILSGNPLPSSVSQFLSDLRILFPNFYDIKHIAE